jgi:acyl-CoA thioesterase
VNDPITAPSDLASATAVRKLDRAPGWYVADLPPYWNYFSPSGGVLMTVAMRAMEAELADEEFRPVSANTLFCSPVPHGPLEIRVEVIRRGNAAVQMRAALSSTLKPGPGLEVSATFARMREGVDVLAAEPHGLGGPADAEDAADREMSLAKIGAIPFFGNFDMRLAHGPAFWRSQWEGSEARSAFWYRYRIPQRAAAGHLDPFAIPPLADTMPPSLLVRVGPEAPRVYAPSLDLTVHFLDPSPSQWLLVDVRCPRARAGYATARADIWDDGGKLVATATQTMILRRDPRVGSG